MEMDGVDGGRLLNSGRLRCSASPNPQAQFLRDAPTLP